MEQKRKFEFVELKEQEFSKFAKNHHCTSFYQLPEWGKLKEINGWRYYLVGIKQSGKVVAATLLLEKPTPIRKNIFYSPKGFLIDFEDLELLRFFVSQIRRFVKNHNGFFLKIDPYVVYQKRDKDGNEIGARNDSAVDTLKSLGFKHFGFNYEFETMQPRFLCGFKLSESYEETIKNFSKTTRKHILDLDNLGVTVKKASIDEIGIAVSLLDETANRKKFSNRPTSYYVKMKELLKDKMDFFLCYIDKEEAIKKYKSLIDLEEERKLQIHKKMQNSIVGKKLNQELELCERKINDLKEKIEFVGSLEKEKTYIGSLLSIWVGKESITLLSGTNNNFKRFKPKYAFYNEHIKESIRQKKEYVNFFGISGIFDSNDKNYGIYEIKKGFNPEVIELIGEFDLVISKFWYIAYKILFKLYKIIK